MPDVFLSYSRQDLEAVARLANKIQQAGYDVWWDAELPPHKSYSDVIEEKVASAKAAVVVWSPTARESEWVRAEADMARSQKKLIQTALGDIMPPLPFNQIQFADLAKWNGEDDHPGWKKVLESLSDLCGEREAGAGGAQDGADPAPIAAAVPTGAAATGTARPAARQVSNTPATSASKAPIPEATVGTHDEIPPVPTPPPGSVEYYRARPSKLPVILAAAVGGIAVLGGGAAAIGALWDNDDEFEMADEMVAPAEMQAAPPPSAAQPTTSQPAAPRFSTGPQTFSGMINEGGSSTHRVGLNANTSYMIVAECDQDCSDIDMWLYDESGNLIDEDVLDDDVPVLQVSPARSATFELRLQMFACSIEPCGYEITVQPL